MRHTSYFLISPKPELIDRLDKYGASGLSDLTQPVMWSGDEPDRGILRHSDFEVLLKILFLDTLQRERAGDEAFCALFAGITTTDEYFDSLWFLSRVSLDMSMEVAIEDAIETGSIEGLMRSGNSRVDEALKLYLTRRRPKAAP